ncbi:interleukin-8-like [Opisthocomus hoazin]|uniref:interleukin-8-like n=1 Tax=Opisthocomus hoazin TaxID=30419 RepID=UPI003F53D877
MMQFAEQNKAYEHMLVAETSKQYVHIANDVQLAKTEEKGFQRLSISPHSKFIPPKATQNVRLRQRGSRCKNVETIATLKGGRRVCLEPPAPWVQLTVRAILARTRDNTESPIKEKSRKSIPWSFPRI